MPFFRDFALQPATLNALDRMQISEPTPIQAQAIPALLEGKDLVGQSATGSGKTLAYSIPLVERLSRKSRATQALVLVPTRELALQINAVLSKLATSRQLSMALLVGGRAYNTQISALRYGAQIVVGTPGRIKDHIDRGTLVLSQLRICVLDEADQMLDSGFAPAIEEILATTPETRQMALFSATMPDWVAKLEEKFLKDPVKIEITPAVGAESTIEQIAYQVPHNQKIAALCTLLYATGGESTLIFGRTKFGVEKLSAQLSKMGFTVGTLHGDKSQRAREEVLSAFRRGHMQTLLATNVAARGLDIQGIYQVINYELPESSELFTHRIGRTGRMGRQGKAITLLVPSDLPKWRRMARTLGQNVQVQRLTINEEALTLKPVESAEVQLEQMREQAEPRGERRGRGQGAERDAYLRPASVRPTRSRRAAAFENESPEDGQFFEQGERRNVVEREREPRGELRLLRGRKQPFQDERRGRNNERPMRPTRQPFSFEQESEHLRDEESEGYAAPRLNRKRRDEMVVEYPARIPARRAERNKEELVVESPERVPARRTEEVTIGDRHYSLPGREPRRGSGRFGRTVNKRKDHPFTATESQPRSEDRRSQRLSAPRKRGGAPANRRFAR